MIDDKKNLLEDDEKLIELSGENSDENSEEAQEMISRSYRATLGLIVNNVGPKFSMQIFGMGVSMFETSGLRCGESKGCDAKLGTSNWH